MMTSLRRSVAPSTDDNEASSTAHNDSSSTLSGARAGADAGSGQRLDQRVGLDPGTAGELYELVSDRTAAVDAGDADPRPVLAELGRGGLLGPGAADDHGLATAAGVIATLARGCMATAFSTWAQRIVVEYLIAADGATVADELLPRLTSGRLAGSTAMATAFQDYLGIRDIPVEIHEAGGSFLLNGRIGWASNLYEDGHLIVLPARFADGRRTVVTLDADTSGLRRAPYPPLLALQATASTGFTLEGVAVPPGRLLTDDFARFLETVRPAFLLLQAAFCVGLAEASLDAIHDDLDGFARALAGDLDRLRRRHDDVAARLARQLPVAHDADGDEAGDAVVAARLDAARLAGDAVALEAKLIGGRGYLAHSDTARRLREAAFLPIQSPTEAQLKWELQRSA